MGNPLSDFFLDNPRKLDDPFADLAWLREHHPVHRHEPIGQWFVFPYEEVRSLFGDRRMSADRIAGFAEAAPASVRDEVRQIVPYLETWLIFRDGCPGGESPEEVGARVDRVIPGPERPTQMSRCRAWPCASGARSALDRSAGGGGTAFPARYGHPVCPGLLPRHTRGEGLERASH